MFQTEDPMKKKPQAPGPDEEAEELLIFEEEEGED